MIKETIKIIKKMQTTKKILMMKFQKKNVLVSKMMIETEEDRVQLIIDENGDD